MLRLEIGKKYRFTLDTEKEMELVVRGTKAAPKGLELLDIEVDGLRGTYFDVNAALGHLPFVKVEKVSESSDSLVR